MRPPAVTLPVAYSQVSEVNFLLMLGNFKKVQIKVSTVSPIFSLKFRYFDAGILFLAETKFAKSIRTLKLYFFFIWRLRSVWVSAASRAHFEMPEWMSKQVELCDTVRFTLGLQIRCRRSIGSVSGWLDTFASIVNIAVARFCHLATTHMHCTATNET